jgi:PAS domain S-box-containing protein
VRRRKGGREIVGQRKPRGEEVDPILESIADGVFTIDLDWRITSFNRAAEAITGCRRSNAIGQKCYDVFRASVCQSACAMKTTLESGSQLIDLQVDILNSQGRIIPISISTAVLRNKSGKIVGGVETFRDLSCVEAIRRQLNQKFQVADIISKNSSLLKVLETLPAIAESGSTVLVEGPSGSGKELVSRALHTLSPRSAGAFVAVNCSALPDTLLESELFGYMRGAFTDAHQDKPGRIARAEKGTLFLDEIGDVSPTLQPKLLRFLQEREYEPLGAVRSKKADVRIIAATNQDLAVKVEQGGFRRDLYYRLNVIRLKLPPLSSRREDIPLLVEHFLARFNTLMRKRIQSVSAEVMTLFMHYDFPGNIRELANSLEHAVVLCTKPQILIEHLPEEMLRSRLNLSESAVCVCDLDPLKSAEAETIRKALSKHNDNRRQTAAALGISVVTLWRKMKALGV